MFIQGNYIYWTLLHSRNSRNIYSKIVPSHFMIILSFTITISWIKYSYSFFRLKDEEIVDMIEGSVLWSLSVSFLLPSCEEIPPEALPAFDTISLPKSDMPASKLFISKRSIEHSSDCEFLLKIYHFLSFWKSLSSTKLTYTQALSAKIYTLTLVLMRTFRETHFRLWTNREITLVTMTYHKPMTGSVPLCPLMSSWSYIRHKINIFS